MSKEYTEEEVNDKVINHILGLIDYWGGLPEKDTEERLEGLAFSILSMLDGSSMGLPRFIVAPDPHPEDKEYHIEEGENWYAENHEADIKCNLAGGLHDSLHPLKKIKDK